MGCPCWILWGGKCLSLKICMQTEIIVCYVAGQMSDVKLIVFTVKNVTRLTGIKAIFFLFFHNPNGSVRTVSALETPISNHIHFPPPQLNGFSFQATVIHSQVYTRIAVIPLKHKGKRNTSNAQTPNVSLPSHMEASPSNLCGQEESIFFSLTQ